jgi:choline dehydrogenase
MKDHGRTRVKSDGFSFHLCQLRPESRGRITLGSTDPTADPLIYANYLASEVDRRVLRDCVHIGREIAYQAALDPYRGAEYAPGREVQSDAEIDAWIRQSAETIYHPVGTCKMGVGGDAMAVLDETLRVRGLQGLRVVDASVMPTLVGSNTNAPTIMIAEKAADLIRGMQTKAALAA